MSKLAVNIKGIFCFVLLLATATNTSAQTAADTILTIAEQMPYYPGGTDSLLKEITKNVVYPKFCADSNIQGKVYLRFVVNTDGSLADLQAIKSPHPAMSVAAMDAVLKIGKFTPGMQDGKPVRVWYSLPVTFKVKQVNTESLADSIFTSVDEPAVYLTGEENLKIDLQKNMFYPGEEFKQGIQGQVVLNLVIDKTGKIDTVIVVKGVSSGLANEALRIVKLLSAFRPATFHGEAVKSYYTLPVDFNLRHDEFTIYIGSMAFLSVQTTTGNTGGISDNHGKFLFYYYEGGYDAFSKLMNANMQFPAEALKSKLESVLKVRCSISSDFRLEPQTCLNDPDSIFTKEAFRLIKLCPPFKKEIETSTFLKDTLPVSVIFVMDKRHQWGASATKDESEADMLTEQGIDFYNKEKYEKALEFFSAAIRYYSLHSRAYFNIAATELKMNNKKGACEDFYRALLLGDMDAKDALKQVCR